MAMDRLSMLLIWITPCRVMFELDRQVTPCPHNPLGVKGAGEAGCIGSTPAVVNAVIDALWSGGHKVKDIRMPLTPERVWTAMQS
jgi:aerobic carbon-monoxide dehydrogenase large subunit